MNEAVNAGLMKRTWKDLLLYFPAIVIQGIVGLLIAAILSKSFSPEEYGNFVLAFGIYNLLYLITGAWLSFSILRLVPEYKGRGRLDGLLFTFISTEAALGFLSFGMGGLVLLLLKGVLEEQLLRLFFVALVGSVTLCGTGAIQQIYRIEGDPYRYSIVVLIRVLGGLVIGTGFIKVFGMDVVGFFVGMISPSFAIIFWFLVKRRKRVGSLLCMSGFEKGALRDALQYSLPIVMMNVMAMVLGMSDRYLIRGYLSSYEVGVYALGYMIANQGIQLFQTVLMTAAEPIAYKSLEEHGTSTAMGYLAQILRYYTLLVFPGLVGICVLGKELIYLFSTEEYLSALPVILFVGGGMLFHGYTQILNRVFGFKKETVTPMVNFTIAGALNVGLNVALIPWFGFMAAAWSTLSAYGVLFLITLKTCRSVIPLKFFQSYHWKGVLGATGMGLFLNLYKDMVGSQMLGFVSSICGGVLVYTGLLFVLGELRYEKVRSLVIMMGGFLVRPFSLKKSGKI